MNSQKAKVLRKWSTLRGLGYTKVKQLYNSLSKEDQGKMLDEAVTYVRSVNAGIIEASQPKLPTEADFDEMVKKRVTRMR